jgi:diguanylate cyclase (GGDEF)-like protein
VTNYIGTHYDITERKLAEDKIEELAFFDSLTHLPNRRLLLDRLKQIMIESNRDKIFGAVLFIDIDHFKRLNDTLGHVKGDILLQHVAHRLISCVREGDTVGRLGGDEFLVVLKNLNFSIQESASLTEAIGTKILNTLSQTYILGDIDYRTTASIGATLFCGDETSIEDLLKQADLAMYKSKDTGRNTLRFFDADMESAVMKRAALESDLHEALQKNQFILNYQAQFGDGLLIGSEALVRWQHPLHGMIPPNEFIPLAEETGQILKLGRWVLETACVQLATWAGQPSMAQLTISVNVSAHEFHQDNFVDQVLEILTNSHANPHLLKLELTESMLVSNIEIVIEKMLILKAKGVGFSLDDFGTGFSSLSYLKRMPLNQLKIDQSFVRDVLTDSNDASIVKTIITLAESLNLNVIAEGVETAAQREFLANAGCHAYQGYLYSRPLPIEKFEALVQENFANLEPV